MANRQRSTNHDDALGDDEAVSVPVSSNEELVTPACRRTRSTKGRISLRVRPGILDGREVPPDMPQAEVIHRRKVYDQLMARGMEYAVSVTGMSERELSDCARMAYIPDRDWFFIKLTADGSEVPPDMPQAEVIHRREVYDQLMARGMKHAMSVTGMSERELSECARLAYIPDRDWFFIKLTASDSSAS